MNKTFLALIIAIIAMASIACAMPVTVDKVIVNGVLLSADDVNRLDIDKGEEISVKIEATSQSDLQDVEIEAFITGYEYNSRERISDSTDAFDMEENTTYSKRLRLSLPERMDNDEYKLRIIISDRNNDDTVEEYNLRIGAQRHLLQIRDILMTPESYVKAGSFLLASVRVKNIGEKDEDSVKVTLAVPDLGLSQSTYIDEIEADDTESSEEIFLTIPKCAEQGEYALIAKITYDEGYETVMDYSTFLVNGGACDADEEEEEEPEEEEEEVNVQVPPASLLQQQQVDAQQNGKAKVRNALEIALVVLIIILVILGLIIGFSKLNSDEELY